MKATKEFAKLWEPGISGIELFSAQFVSHQFGKHFHEAYTIGISDGGHGRFMYRGETHTVHSGYFHLINPGEVHTGQVAFDQGWTLRDIYISVPLIKQLLTQLEWNDKTLPYFKEATAWDTSLQSAFNRLFQALSQPLSSLTLQSLLLEALSQLLSRHAEPRCQLRSPQSETKAIALIRAYLEAHYTENISIDALSQLVSLSPYYLIRCFHRQVGLPPHSYQRQWQLLQAKRSLHTSKALSIVATENGFYDQSHLNRSFKRAFGITPGQYRQSNSIQYR